MLLSLVLPAAPAAGSNVSRTALAGAQQETQPPAAAFVADAQQILEGMSVADKVGQLFLISFVGQDVTPDSDIATLVRDYRIGGVVLLPSNDNFRTVPVSRGPAAEMPGAIEEEVSTPLQIAEMTEALQRLALSAPRPITATVSVTSTEPISATAVLTPTMTVTATAAAPLRDDRPAVERPAASPVATAANPEAPPPEPSPTPTPEDPNEVLPGLPLLIGLDWVGDDRSFLSGLGGFTPLPSAMAIGATWSPQLAEQAGQVMGSELRAAGINLLLGPPLDVLDTPRPGSKGDLNTRTFGGDPFWVGQIGQAFIRGVQIGGGGVVIPAGKHFPGQGGSDRGPEDEVATVQKSVEQLRQIEIAPFSAVTGSGDFSVAGITPALLTSHIRYRGFQGNIRETTPPISLAPQLQDLMDLPEFAAWRAAGGVLISDALGVPALRRYYSPTLIEFPHRRVAQDAFLAGNDLLYLGRFALTDNWPDQVKAIQETVLFFQEKYGSDSAFAARVDAAVLRIVTLKLRSYGGRWLRSDLVRDEATVAAQVGQSSSVTRAIARAGLTLIYPGQEQFADRLPAAPAVNEKIVIFTDARTVRECPACDPVSLIGPTALQDIILQLYGPDATGQVDAGNVSSFTYRDLAASLLAPEENAVVERAIDEARWIIFAQLDQRPQEYPESIALSDFLARRSDGLRDKRIVVLAFAAPYYLDTTEVSKLTAYFGVYGHTAPFLETAVRALFREFTPVGAPPVTVTGINYELINQLEPAPGQVISLAPVGSGDVMTGSIQVGSQIALETGIILDRKGHPVPDGTPVEFHLRYPTESLALAPRVETTVGGRARTIVPLDRPGELWITVQSGEAKNSTRIELRVGGDAPGSIATVVPTPTPSPTATPTITPSPTATWTATPEPTDTPVPAPEPPPPPKPRVGMPAFFAGLAGTLLSGGIVFASSRRGRNGLAGASNLRSTVAALWAGAAAWGAYVLYAVGWLPGSTVVQARGWAWVAGAVTFVAGLLTLFWTGRERPA